MRMRFPTRRSSPTTNVGYVILIAAAAALGGFLFGFDTAVINGAVLALKSEFNTTSVGIGLSVSLALLGSAVGAFFAGPLADRIGRVRCMVIAAILFLVSAIGSGAPFGIARLHFLAHHRRYRRRCRQRHRTGLHRGGLAGGNPRPAGVLQQLAIVVGIFVALLGDFALAGAAGSAEAPLWFGLKRGDGCSGRRPSRRSPTASARWSFPSRRAISSRKGAISRRNGSSRAD